MSSKDRPKKCPHCNYIFKDPQKNLAKEFIWPKLPDTQFFEIVQQETEKLLDASNEKLFENTKIKVPEEITIHRKTKIMHIKSLWNYKLDEFLMDTSSEQVEELMMLVLKLMDLAIPSGDSQKARVMFQLGEKIVHKTNILKEYCKHGGRFIKRKPTKEK